jgi:hypothetical protein
MSLFACDAEQVEDLGVNTRTLTPEMCKLKWDAMLESERSMVFREDEYWPEMAVLDGDLGGDTELASQVMRSRGWYGVASPPEDRSDTMYFLPNGEAFGSSPPAKPGDGLLPACEASYISGVPFTKVIRRYTAEGGGVAYEVSNR